MPPLSLQAYQNLVRVAGKGQLRQEMWLFLQKSSPCKPDTWKGGGQRKNYPDPFSRASLTSPAGASHWLNPSGSQRPKSPTEAARAGQALGHRAGRRLPTTLGPAVWLYSCLPYFLLSVQVEIRHSKSQMKIHEIYCPPGGFWSN